MRAAEVGHEGRGGGQGVVDAQLLPILHESLDDVGDVAGSLCLPGGADQDVDQRGRLLCGDCPQQPQGQGYDGEEPELALGHDDVFPVP